NRDPATFDIHDRVNYAVVRSFLSVDAAARAVTLELTIETEVTSVLEYFEIFLQRMIMSRRAAEFLDCRFHLVINGAGLAEEVQAGGGSVEAENARLRPAGAGKLCQAAHHGAVWGRTGAGRAGPGRDPAAVSPGADPAARLPARSGGDRHRGQRL